MAEASSKMTTGRRATETGCDSGTGRDCAGGECAIAVTQEMIEAGKDVISGVWVDFINQYEVYEETIAEIYRAMRKLQP
jgi:hypothetical protein